jgi:catechol 2,3-dioxygenase-like lactoylglutathione lyase family enzyme
MALTRGFNHVATLTPDLDRYTDFYVRVFGGEVTFTMEATGDHPRMHIIDLGGGAALNAFEVPADTIIGETRTLGARGAIDHFALAVGSVSELEGIRDRLADAGADLGEIQRLGHEWSLFFRDVDGRELEVCCPADD